MQCDSLVVAVEALTTQILASSIGIIIMLGSLGLGLFSAIHGRRVR